MNEPKKISPRPTLAQIEQEISRLESGREIKKSISDTVKNLLVIAAAAILLSNLLISVLTVNLSSMNPTLQDGEVVIALKWLSVKPGEIIAFHYNNKILLKRVIAVAGDWVDISEDGTVSVNGAVLDEPYVIEKSLSECDITLPYQVPDGSYFVMGDHRSVSLDSRMTDIGPISADDIVGRVVLRIWPMQRFGLPE